VELFRRSGVDRVANKVLPAKGSTKGLRQGQTVESFMLLSALGGDCIEVKRRTVSSYIDVVHPGGDVTLDVDVQLTETTKDGAQYC
jgi:pseudouridine-5'-phosphate glycosidase